MAQLENDDCLNAMKKIPDASIDLIITDPPYELNNMQPYFDEFVRILKRSGSVYVFGDKNMIAEHWFSQMKIPNKQLLIWHYKNSPKPRGRWRLSMQGIIYGFFDRKESTFHEDYARVEYLPSTKKLNGRKRPSSGRLDECHEYDTSKGALPRDVIECPALLGHLSHERVGHPDQKPLQLIEKLILASSNEDDLVFDPFCGSGTTLLACKNTNRRYHGVEINSEYVKMARERLK